MTVIQYSIDGGVAPDALHAALAEALPNVFLGLGWTAWPDRPGELLINCARQLTEAEQNTMTQIVEAH